MSEKRKKMRLRQRPYRYAYIAVAPCGCALAFCSGRKQERRRAARFAGRMMAAGYQVQHTGPAEIGGRSLAGCQCPSKPTPAGCALQTPACVIHPYDSGGF